MNQASHQEIIHYAVQFFAIAAIFQLFEAARISLFGALRALHDTKFPLLTSAISFWCIALPIGYFLAIKCHLDGVGIWWGMVAGAS
ncbi:MATE family efflux transporter, partial [Escherichia coli]